MRFYYKNSINFFFFHQNLLNKLLKKGTEVSSVYLVPIKRMEKEKSCKKKKKKYMETQNFGLLSPL